MLPACQVRLKNTRQSWNQMGPEISNQHYWLHGCKRFARLQGTTKAPTYAGKKECNYWEKATAARAHNEYTAKKQGNSDWQSQKDVNGINHHRNNNANTPSCCSTQTTTTITRNTRWREMKGSMKPRNAKSAIPCKRRTTKREDMETNPAPPRLSTC